MADFFGVKSINIFGHNCLLEYVYSRIELNHQEGGSIANRTRPVTLCCSQSPADPSLSDYFGLCDTLLRKLNFLFKSAISHFIKSFNLKRSNLEKYSSRRHFMSSLGGHSNRRPTLACVDRKRKFIESSPIKLFNSRPLTGLNF